jgi:putative ABC transport system permease protein
LIDHAAADLWIVTNGAKSFEDMSLLDSNVRDKALAVNGVASVVPVVVGFSNWKLPGGSMTPVFIVGSDLKNGALVPWNIANGSVEALNASGAVAIDRSYFDRLGVSAIGSAAEIRGHAIKVAAVTDGIRSFTTTPYVFMDVDRARAHTGVPSNKATYFLVRVGKGADIEQVRRNLLASLADVEVLTPAEFRERSRQFWLFGTGAGAALFAGALLGVIVGTVIVAQTLYSSTKDHLNEFATLRAIGSSRKYIYKVIICQALLSAVIGFGLAYLIGLLVVRLTASGALPIVITPGLTMALFLLTVVMCVVSAIAAIMKVTRIDPAMVFTR